MFNLQVRKFSLAQGRVDAATGRVIVVDANDRPVPNASVSVNGLEGRTDSYGIFNFPLPIVTPGGSLTILVQDDRYSVKTTRPATEVEVGAYVKIPVCLAQPILTTVELGALAAGIGLATVGMVWKQKHAEIVGEVLVGAAAFTAIYRHSCL
jgi:hypothetical protein